MGSQTVEQQQRLLQGSQIYTYTDIQFLFLVLAPQWQFLNSFGLSLYCFTRVNLYLYSGFESIFFIFISFIFISWRLITLQYCSGFCHTLTWISHGFTCIPHPDPLSHPLPIPSLWVFPVHQPQALVSCIQPGLAICFTFDNIHVSMLFSQIIPPLPSLTESKSLFCTSVSLFLSCI